MRQWSPDLAREQRANLDLDLLGIGLVGPTEAPREAPEVRIHGDPWDVKCVT